MSSQSYFFNPREDRMALAGMGLQLPRLTTAQRTALSVDAGDAGLQCFDTDLAQFFGWDGTAWIALSL